MISKAATLDVISGGEGSNCDVLVQLIFAEFQMLTPMVPARQVYFVTYCRSLIPAAEAQRIGRKTQSTAMCYSTHYTRRRRQHLLNWHQRIHYHRQLSLLSLTNGVKIKYRETGSIQSTYAVDSYQGCHHVTPTNFPTRAENNRVGRSQAAS